MCNNRPRFFHTQIFLVPYLLGEVYKWGRDSVGGGRAAKSSPVLWGTEYNSKLILGMPHSINSLLVEWLRICFGFSSTFLKNISSFQLVFYSPFFFSWLSPISQGPCLGVFWWDWPVKVAFVRKDPAMSVNGLANGCGDARLSWVSPAQGYWLRKWRQGSPFCSNSCAFRRFSCLGQNKALLWLSTLHPNSSYSFIFLAFPWCS